MTEEEKKAQSVGVRRDLNGDVIGKYSMRQDNTRLKDISPLEAPEFTDEQIKSLDFTVNGEGDGYARYDRFGSLRKESDYVRNGTDSNVEMRERYTKPNGDQMDVKIGELKASKLLPKKDDDGISMSELQQTAKRVDPRFGRGNIDLDNRKVVNNPDGTISTERSISINVDGKEVLIPTVIDGKIVSDDEAIEHFKKTGENLGVFDTVEEANNYADRLHRRQQSRYGL